MKIIATCCITEGSIGFGITSCNPDSLKHHGLPDDLYGLLDRNENWVYLPNIAAGTEVLDELCFPVFESGYDFAKPQSLWNICIQSLKNCRFLLLTARVEMSRNDGPPVYLMDVDSTVPLYMFFNLDGSVQIIYLQGSIVHPQKG